MPRRKKKKNDYFLVISAAVLLVLTGLFIFWFSGKKTPSGMPSDRQLIGRVVLTIDFDNGNKRIFDGNVVEGETLIDILIQATKAGNLYFKLDEKNNVAAIESFVRSEEKIWRWYLNEKRITKPLSEVILKAGDRITLKYESR